MGKCYCFTSEQWFSNFSGHYDLNFSGHYDHLKGLSNYKLMDATLTYLSDLFIFARVWPKLCISNTFTDTTDGSQ